jgi:hypothetical protein
MCQGFIKGFTDRKVTPMNDFKKCMEVKYLSRPPIEIEKKIKVEPKTTLQFLLEMEKDFSKDLHKSFPFLDKD